MAINQDWRRTREYRLWRVSVIRRDKVCKVCKSRNKRQAHHKNHASYFVSERFNVLNGVTLCSSCHINYHTNFHRSFRVKCTKYDFDNFLSLWSYFVSRVSFDLFV